MAMAAEAGPEVVDDVIGGGLSGSQKAQAGFMGLGSISPIRTAHPFIIGGILLAVGAFGLVGSLTGNLPSMIAALFVPDALTDKNDKTPAVLQDANTVIKLVNGVGQFLNPVSGAFSYIISGL